jgi:hypothetical protein
LAKSEIVYISLVSFETVQKRPFSNPTFFDLSQNWHNKSFWQKTDVRLLIMPKNLHDFSWQPCSFFVGGFLA